MSCNKKLSGTTQRERLNSSEEPFFAEGGYVFYRDGLFAHSGKASAEKNDYYCWEYRWNPDSKYIQWRYVYNTIWIDWYAEPGLRVADRYREALLREVFAAVTESEGGER